MVENCDRKIFCVECKNGGNAIFIDTITGEVVCRVCGTVQPVKWWKNEIYE